MHQGGTDLLLSHVPYTATNSSNIFGIGSEYPFSNYWTLSGGLAEVICVLPSKEQADMYAQIGLIQLWYFVALILSAV